MDGRAEQLVAARAEARGLARYPGVLPATLADAYAVQDETLRLCSRRLAGWKVAMIGPAFRERYPAERLVGPVFADAVQFVGNGGTVPVHVYEDGFAAIEAEFVVRITQDLPTGDKWLTAGDIAACATVHVGSEIASSPLATINDLGPGAVISDHGNNAGAIIGPEIPRELTADWAALVSRTLVEGELVGEGSAARVPGGPFAAVAFLAANLDERGYRLRKGDVILTGMTTGIHPVRPGDRARLDFPGVGHFDLHIHARQPSRKAAS